ncbi:hypothetical protein L1887_14419 [Cichorium endivia]|nr:hypothetical protein L1887_14419 [Cichorium endivia]
MGCSASVIVVDLAKDMLQVHRNTYAVVVSTQKHHPELVGDMDKSSKTGSQRPIPAIIPRFCGDSDHNHRTKKDISMRQWLDNTERAIDALENMHIFMQIVKIASLAHAQGLVVHNIRPSCFVMSSFSQVSFIESASCSDSSADSYHDVTSSHTDSYKNLPNDFHKGSENTC